MSKFTTEVRFICESEAGLVESVGYNSIEQVLTLSAPRIFNFNFPIFDEEYRLPLEKKILKHFYTREISEETVGLWKLRLDTKMNEIMPYYNQLYKSELLMAGIENPLGDVDYKRETLAHGLANSTGQNNVTNDSDNVHWQYYSDTPQGDITGVDELTYLTNLQKDTDHVDGHTVATSSNTGNTTDDFIEHVYGKKNPKTYGKTIKELRDSFLNIDMMIIKDLESLFFGLWE